MNAIEYHWRSLHAITRMLARELVEGNSMGLVLGIKVASKLIHTDFRKSP